MTEIIEGQIIETGPATTEIARVMAEGDPDIQLALIEKKAANAVKMRAAMEKILISQTYPADWTIQGEGDKAKACLSSAGAERIGRNFDITFSDVKHVREDFEDKDGKGYRYVFTGYATMYGRRVYCEGSYSTRDEFLGKAHGEWRPIEDINEGDVRSAAHHIMMGAGIKELLGLRGMPAAEYRRIMNTTGQDANQSSTVARGTGTQGGTSSDDHASQKELGEICLAIANAGYGVQKGADGKYWEICENPADERPAIEQAKDICVSISSFIGKEGETVAGKLPKELKGARLTNTLTTARKLKEKLERRVGA